ncbi:MAG: DUF3047 domain-containing protein [Candidatus Rokubacteria bacterium]|nr:DUF3047 domain-containing protein [Candidatus Rokubacteria bacterium]
MARRLAALSGCLALVVFGALAAPDSVLVEDWVRHAPGTKGIPEGWKGGQRWGNPAYEFRVAQDGPTKALHLTSRGDSSTISKEVKVDLRDTPVLEWQWKVVTLPKGGDARNKNADDQAIQLYVTWERFPSLVRSRIIGYIWDSGAPAGSVLKSQKTGLVTYVVVRSGAADEGKWLTESRNVYEDYKRIYGEEPDAPGTLSIAIDSDDTQSSAEAYIGAIRFRKP